MANISYYSTHYTIRSRLQPGNEGNCISMIPIHDEWPSWYSLPCRGFSANAYICKKRMETRRPIPFHVISNNLFSTCGVGQMRFVSKCYTLKRVQNVRPYFTKSIKPLDREYVIRFFSYICKHTLQKYNFLETTHHSADIDSTPCVKIYPSYAQEKYMPPIIIRSTLCNTLHPSNTYVAESGSMASASNCKINQQSCHDGSCSLQDDLCSTGDSCSLPDCVCYKNGEKIFNNDYCHSECALSTCHCGPHFFQCSSGGCIQMSFICDGRAQCTDASDEMCGTETFPVLYDTVRHPYDYALFTDGNFCLGYLCNSGYCISTKHVDDLIPDCPGGDAEDEPMYLGLRFRGKYNECNNPENIPCVVGLPICFPIDKFCLYDTDKDGNPRWCRNGAHLGECAAIICTNSYKCYESYCIPFHHVCNGHSDCINGDDEEKCHEYQCQGLLRCRGTRVCVHSNQVCDGVRQCAEGDDEQLCDIQRCPADCRCLSYSTICSTKNINEMPLLLTDTLKHISVQYSYLPLPDFQHFSHQKNILYLNLTGNRIRYICKSLQNRYKFHRKLRILDLANNLIYVLAPNCFKHMTVLKVLCLANNPIHTIQDHAFELLSLSYINSQGTDVTSLSNDGVSDIKDVCILDIRAVNLKYINHHVVKFLSDIPEMLFDDSRLYCIFPSMKYRASVLISCPRILPHIFLGYIILVAGISLFSMNLVAIFVNVILSINHTNSLLVLLLLICDAALALYVTILGMSDIYYDNHFVLSLSSWHQCGLCRFMRVLSGTATMLTQSMWTFIIVVTSKGLMKVRFAMSYRRYCVFFSLISFCVVLYNVLLEMGQTNIDNSFTSVVHVCYFVDNEKFNPSIRIVSSMILSISMLISYLIVSFSAFKVVMFIAQTTSDVEKYSGIKRNIGQDQKNKARKVFIDLVLEKSLTNLPYPLLLMVSLIKTDIPEGAHLSVMFAFIVMETFFSPIFFVFKPLWKINIHKA